MHPTKVGSGLLAWKLRFDGHAVAGRGIQMEAAAGALGSFAHSTETEVVTLLSLGWIGIEAATIVKDMERQGVVRVGERYFDVGGATVKNGIGDCFAGNHQQIMGRWVAESERNSCGLVGDGGVELLAHLRDHACHFFVDVANVAFRLAKIPDGLAGFIDGGAQLGAGEFEQVGAVA